LFHQDFSQLLEDWKMTFVCYPCEFTWAQLPINFKIKNLILDDASAQNAFFQ
jgi:hypothetical protein